MRISTVLKVFLGLIVLIIGALGVFIATLDVSQYKGQIIALIEDNTGRSVTIDGEMDLAIGFAPALVVEGVTIGNADWASDPNMVSVGRLEAQVDLIPLLSGEIKVVRLILVDPAVSLETDKAGNGNWVMGAVAGDQPSAALPEPADTTATAGSEGAGAGESAAPPNFQIQEVRLENGSLTYRDGVSGQTMKVALERVSLTGGGLADPLTMDIAGAYNNAAFTLAGTVGALTALSEPGGAPWPLDLTATAGGATVVVNGSIANPTKAKGLDLAITARGAQIADLAALARAVGQSVSVPALGPYSVSLQLKGDADALSVSGLDAGLGSPENFRVSATGSIANALAQSGIDLNVSANVPDPAVLADMGAALPVPLTASASVRDIAGGYGVRNIQATLGRSSMTGAIEAKLDGVRPAISGQLNAPLLDLNELSGGSPAGGGASGGSGGGRASAPAPAASGGNSGGFMIPDTPLPLDGLNAADVAMTITVEKAILPGGPEVGGLNLGINLNNGALSVSPLQAMVAGGAVNGSVALKPVGNGVASVAVDLTGDGVRLGDLAKTFGGSDALSDGPTTLRVKLQGQGASPHQIAGTLAGSILLHTVDARMNNGAVNWAGGDVFSQLGDLINPFSESEPTTPIQCLVFNMTAAQGVLSNDVGLAFETDKMAVSGGGAFDLGAERLNVKIAPRPRPGIGLETGFGKLVELFAVSGPFASPSLELDAEKALETGLRTAASTVGAVATGGLSLLGENLLSGGGDGELEPCLVALGQKEPGQGGSSDPADGGQASPLDGIGDQIQQQIEGLTGGADSDVGGAIRDILGGGGGTAPAPADGAPAEEPASDGGLGDAVRGLGGLLGN